MADGHHTENSELALLRDQLLRMFAQNAREAEYDAPDISESEDARGAQPDMLEQLRQDILRIRRERRFDKYPPKMTVNEDGDVIFDIPEKVYENRTARTEDLKLIAEIKLYDDPLIPVTVDFYFDDDA